MRRSRLVATTTLALAAGLTISMTAQAAPYNEIGDAGQTPAGAQSVNGTGPLTSIIGTFASGADSDVYVIRISDPATFSAVTSSATANADHQIQLFHLNGAGIAFNDDDPDDLSGFTSRLPAGNALYSGLTPGLYLLGISEFDNDAFIVPNPQAQSDYVFPFNGIDPRLVSGPNPGSVGIPFIDYDTTFGPNIPDGQYTITLTGAQFVPEPASMSVIVLGSLLALRRRRA